MSYEPVRGTAAARAVAYLRSLPAGKEVSTAELAEAIDYDKQSMASALGLSKKCGLVIGRIPQGVLYTMWSAGKGVPLPADDDDEPLCAVPVAPINTANVTSSVFDIARGASNEPDSPARGSRQVLKAEAATPDATDRDAPVTTGPGVGPMGAGQAADAAPADEDKLRPEKGPLTAVQTRVQAEATEACSGAGAVTPERTGPAFSSPVRFALWSDGALQIQRSGNDCVVLARSETEALFEYLDGMRREVEA